MLNFQDLFHTGFVVDDLESSMAELTAQLGVRWTPVEERRMKLRGPDGPFRPDLRFTYTTDGPHHLELLQTVPGTVWEPMAAGRFGALTAHHLGIWCDDVAGTSAELVAAGCPLLATYDGDPDRAVGFAYHRLAGGVVVELVDSVRRERFDDWYAGGPFPGGG